MKTKIFLMFIAFSLLFYACEKDAEYKFDGRDIAHLGDDYVFQVDADGIAVTKLIAGQNQYVGTVEVKMGEETITVTYNTDPGWFLTETHLHIAKDEDELFAQITNRAGNPRIGNFAYGAEDIFQTKWEIVIDKSEISPGSEGCYAIAAHAVVASLDAEGGVYISLNTFAANLPETATIAIDHPTNNEESYFKVHVSDADFINGTWPGWCIQTGADILPGPPPTYETEVFSSFETVPGYEAEILMKINWILNQNFIELNESGTPVYFTYGDLQIAMWTLLHGYDIFNTDVKDELRATSPDPLYPSVIGSWTEEKVNEILTQVKDITEFAPECGDVLAIVFIHNGQDVIIEYPYPCYQDETAWGQGGLFKGNSWAMFFKVCP
jgi:hypothetical protein